MIHYRNSLAQVKEQIFQHINRIGADVLYPFRQRMARLSFVPALLLMSTLWSSGADVPQAGETLGFARCIEIALAQHPDLQAYRFSATAAAAQVEQAKSGYYPAVDITTGLRRDHAVATYVHDKPILPGNAVKDGDDISATIGFRQTLYDFGKTRASVDITKQRFFSAQFDYDTIADDAVFRVKTAYYGVLRAAKARDVLAESVTTYEQHLQQAKAFYEAGTKPRYDVTKAELDLSNEQLNLIKAENSLKLGWVSLNKAMGLESSSEYVLNDNLVFAAYPMILEEAIQAALKDRPDLKSLQAKLSGAEEIIKLDKTEYYPLLSADGNYRFDGSDFPLDNGWTARLTMSINIFNGFATKQRVQEAMANASAAKARIESLRLDIHGEIEKDYLFLGEAQQSIANAEIQVRLATENLELANRRYEAGVGNPVEVADAITSMNDASLAQINALYEYKVAQAAIEKAMARR